MRCTFRFRLNHLASLWYAVLALTLQSYLLYLAFERYRLYTEMKWPLGQYPRQWLTAYISLLGACIPLMVLFAAFALFKSGNLAGDNEQLGGRVERVIEIRSPRDGKKQSSRKRRHKEPCCYRCCHLLRSAWQHSPPLPQSIHIAMALAQLVAQQLMLTQLYRFGFINSGDFLNTELDFVYQRSRQLATNLPMGDTRLQGFRITSEELTDSPLAPNLLPILMHARLFGVPLEFVNLLIALFAYSVVYPSVFWRASRAFACCFSTYLLIHCASLIWTYLQWTVLFRVQETNYYSPRPVGIGQHLWPLRPDWIMLFDPLSLLATFLVTMALMQAAPVALYAYGFSKYVQCQRHRHAEAIGEQHKPGIGSDPSPPSSRGYITANGTFPALSSRDNSASSSSTMMKKGNALNVSNRRRVYDDGESHCCEGYTSHVSAIMLLILIVMAKAPSLYAMMLLYQHEEKPLILTCIILDIIYLFSWIVLWLFLTLKRDWNFRVWFEVEELISLQDAHRMPIAGGGGGRRTARDLKNALLLMHGKRMYVTDDPLAKSSIWRHATKSDAQQHKCCYQRGCERSSAVCLYPSAGSPALSYVRKGGSQMEQYAPLAAPPYQNRQQIGLDGSEGGFVVNTFGTLPRGSSTAADGGYGGMMSSAGYYSSSGHRSTITRPQPSYMKVDTVRPPQAAYYSSSTLGRQSARGGGGGSAVASSSPHMQNHHSHSNVAQSRAPASVYATSTLTRTAGQAHAYSPHNNLYGGCYAHAVTGESQQYASGMHSKVVRPSPQFGGRPHRSNVLVGGPIGTATPNSYTKSDVYGTVYPSPQTGGCQQQEPRWHQPQSSQHSDVASDATSCPNSTAETGKDANRPKANGGTRRTTAAGYTTYDGLVVRSGVGSAGSGSDTLTRPHPILTATMVRAKETATKEPTPTNSNGPLTATVASIAPTPAPKPVIHVSNSAISDQGRGGNAVGSAISLNDGVAGRGEEDASTPSAAYSVRELEEMVNEFATSVV